jgi:basic membrane protein A and related proteins
MQKKSTTLTIFIVLMLVVALSACAKPTAAPTAAPTQAATAAATEAAATAAPTEAAKLKVAFIGNQRFGDNGPMDDMAKGADQAAADFGVEVKKVESIDAARFEDDIRAMAKEGYNLIITTFGYMQDPMITVAQEYPDTMFAGIYQDTNLGDKKYANIMGTSFQGGATFYIDGYMAGKITKTNKIGVIPGAEEPGPNSEANAFMQGVKAANPDATVEFAFVGSYEDPAKAKEIAAAMIAKGVDVIQGDGGSDDSGIVEAAQEAGHVAVFSCVGRYPDSAAYAGTIPLGYGATVYDIIKSANEGKFAGGTNSLRDITNKGYYILWADFESYAAKNTEFGPALTAVLTDAKALEAKFLDGTMKDNYDTTTPSWDRIKVTPYQ